MIRKIYLLFTNILNYKNCENMLRYNKGGITQLLSLTQQIQTINPKISFNFSIDSSTRKPTGTLKCTLNLKQNDGTSTVVHIDPSLFLPFINKSNPQLDMVNSKINESNINIKGQVVDLFQKQVLKIISNMNISNDKKEKFLEQVVSDEFKTTFFGKFFAITQFVVDNQKDGIFTQIGMKAFNEGGLFGIGEFKHLESLYLAEAFFSSNPSLLIGGGKIFNNKHVLGLKILSDLEKWNTLLNHVLFIESFKIIPYLALTFENFKLFTAVIGSYGYNKKELINLYKNYSFEIKDDVELKILENNGNYNWIIPLSLEFFSRFQLESVIESSCKLKAFLKIKILDNKVWKLSIGASNESDLKKEVNTKEVNTKEVDTKKEFDFSKITNIFSLLEKLSLNFAVSYTINGHTFTLKFRGNVGNTDSKGDTKSTFTFNPFTYSNKHLDNKGLLKYICSVFKFDYKYETVNNSNTKIIENNQPSIYM